jgi:HPt (histidine-containing phosphotransfer) domain-containing protein
MYMETPGLAADTVLSLRELGGEELLRRLVAMLVELTPQRLSALREGVSHADLPAARGAAHALGSTAGVVGALSLLAAARLVEKATAWPDVQAATRLLELEWGRLLPLLDGWLAACGGVK